MTAASRPYPLPDAKLPQVNLSPSIIEHWKNEARDIVQDITHNRQSWYFRFQDHQHLYKHVYAKHNTEGWVRNIKQTKMIEFMSRGELDMTLDEVIDGLHCENTAEQRAVYAQLYQDTCIDGALLKRFDSQKPTDPFHSVSVKWIVLRSPINMIFHLRDFIYFEYCFTTTDADGRKVLIEFKKSKGFHPHQLHNHDLDITRGSLYAVNAFYMENDRVVMLSQGRQTLGGNLPAWFAASVMPIAFKRVQNHLGLVSARNLIVTVGSPSTRSGEGSRSCQVCRKKFKIARGKKWCRGCGHAVCRDCVMNLVFYKNEIESAARLPFTREKFCLQCILHVRKGWMEGSDNDRIHPNGADPFERSSVTTTTDSVQDFLDQVFSNSLIVSLESNVRDGIVSEVQDRHANRSDLMTSAAKDQVSSSTGSNPQAGKDKCGDVIDMAQDIADQAATLRYFYQQKWRQVVFL